MTGLHHIFELLVTRSPAAVAVVFNGVQLTYRELNARADLLAAHLLTCGVGPNVLVGLCVHRSLEMVIGMLGILKAGGAYVPIDPAYPPQRISYILQDASAPVIVTQRPLVANLPDTGARQVLLDEPYPPQELPASEPRHFAASNLAYVIYTSGSTGHPKGVQIEHRAVINFLDSMRQEPGLQSDDVVLALTTLSFDIAGLEIFLPLTTGARVVVGSWETMIDGAAVMGEIDKHGVTLLQATPTTWRLLLGSGWPGSTKLKALCGGEPMPADLARKLIPRCAELWNMYGPTETTIWSTCARVTNPDRITIGKPIANTETLILNQKLEAVPQGESGELCIGGIGLARGYHNRPDLTAEKFSQHPFRDGERLYRTGDLARLTPEGEIDCLGRLDFQVKIRGHRIELGEIESALCGHPELLQAVVTAYEVTPDDKRLVAYFVAKQNGSPSPKQLREFARDRLPGYMLPTAFVRLEKIPTTPNGKVDRKVLPAPTQEDVATDGRNHPPSTPTEKVLADIWCRALGLSAIGRHDKFFDLGGNSLLAVRVFAEIEKKFSRNLPLATLFNAATVADFAILLDQTSSDHTPWSSLVPIQTSGTKPRFFCVHGAGGNVILYHTLAKCLGSDYPFYGLHSQGLDGKEPPLQTIEAMAERYLAEIQRLQPKGPYCLGGYCMGGTIAFEIAQLLEKQGETVAVLALFDTYNFRRALPSSQMAYLTQRLRFHAGNIFKLRPSHLKSYLSEKLRVARDGEFANLFKSDRHKAETVGTAALKTVQATNDQAAEDYQPKSYQGHLTLFKPRVNYSKFPDPQMGWGGIVLGGIEVVELPMNPHAMLVEPSVQHLATALAAKLDEVALQTGSSFPFSPQMKSGT